MQKVSPVRGLKLREEVQKSVDQTHVAESQPRKGFETLVYGGGELAGDLDRVAESQPRKGFETSMTSREISKALSCCRKSAP